MSDPDPHVPPPVPFHPHDEPDRLETEEQRCAAAHPGRDGEGDPGDDAEGEGRTPAPRSGPADGPRGPGVKHPDDADR